MIRVRKSSGEHMSLVIIWGEARHHEVNQTIHSYRDGELHREFCVF